METAQPDSDSTEVRGESHRLLRRVYEHAGGSTGVVVEPTELGSHLSVEPSLWDFLRYLEEQGLILNHEFSGVELTEAGKTWVETHQG